MPVTSRAARYSTPLLLAATLLFGLALNDGVASSSAAIGGTLLLGAAVYTSGRAKPFQAGGDPSTLLLMVVVLFAAASAVGWPPRGIGPTSESLETLPALIWVALALFVYARGASTTRLTRILLFATTLAFSAAIGAVHIEATNGVGLDVMVLHTEAAEALEEGLNPYTDAVTVANQAPTAPPGDVIEGYVYPPVTGILYAVGEWALAEPRYTSLAGWLVFLTVVGTLAARRQDRASLLLLLMMASVPGWPLVLRAAWTEPVTLALASVAFCYWNRLGVAGVFMGLTLGSKQYFFVTAPVLGLYRGTAWLRRAVLALAVIVLTVGAAMVWDFSAFWSSAIEFHMSTPPRSDSQNLIGLLNSLEIDLVMPSPLPIAAGLVAAVGTGLWAKTRTQWFVAVAFSLAVSFVVSSQAFPNYWFLIVGLCGLAVMGTLSSEVSSNSPRSSDATEASREPTSR